MGTLFSVWIAYLTLLEVAPASAARTSASGLLSNAIRGGWKEQEQPSRCMDMPENLTMCQKVQYNRILLPNLMGQENLEEIQIQMMTWQPLVKLNCNQDTQLFLCSVYAPLCVEQIESYIKPCRSFCQAVKTDCEPPMHAYGYDWPMTMNCTKFPQNDLCIEPHNVAKPAAQRVCKVCRPMKTLESWMYHMCNADIVIRAMVEGLESHGKNHVQVRLQRKKTKVLFKKPTQDGKVKRELRKLKARNIQDCRCDELKASGEMRIITIKRNVQRQQLFVTSVTTWNRRDKDFRAALRHTKRPGGCKQMADKVTNRRSLRRSSRHLFADD